MGCLRVDTVAVAVISSLMTSLIFLFLVTSPSHDQPGPNTRELNADLKQNCPLPSAALAPAAQQPVVYQPSAPSTIQINLLSQGSVPLYDQYVPTGLYEVPDGERQWIVDNGKAEVPSAVGIERRTLTLEIAYYLLRKNIPGDFVETGVYTGGTSILLMRALKRWDLLGAEKRKLWACDSFEGFPDPTEVEPAAKMSPIAKGSFSASLELFKKNLADHQAMDESRLEILQGWFSETLPKAPIKKISYLRLDGDLYISTMDALKALYDKISKGGIVYVDDYLSYDGCKKAIDEFRETRGIKSPLIPQRYPDPNGWYEAVYWYVE